MTTIDRYIDYSTEADRELFQMMAEALAAAPLEDAPERVTVVHSKKIDDRSLLACLLPRVSAPPLMPEPMPIILTFREEDGTWKAPWGIARTILMARELGPERMARRSMTRMLVHLRFGSVTPEAVFARQAAQFEVLAVCGDPPYNIPQFKHFRRQSAAMKAQRDAMRGLPPRDLERQMLARMGENRLPQQDDFFLALYLEARPDIPKIRLPVRGKDETFEAEPYPCLTDEDVREARVVEAPKAGNPAVEFTLTGEGAKLFERITEENLNKKLAIVVDGEVVAAPVVRGKISGKGLITGEFTPEEARTIADRLGYRAKLDALVRGIRAGTVEPGRPAAPKTR